MTVKLPILGNQWTAGNIVLDTDLNDTLDYVHRGGLQLVAGENLTAQNPAYISILDHKLYISHGYKKTEDVDNSFTVSTSEKIAKLSNTEMLFLTHSGSTLSVTLYNKSTEAQNTATVTTSFDTDSISTTLTGATVSRISNTAFVVFYVVTSNSSLYYRTGTVSGGTITMGTATQYTGNPNDVFGIDANPADTDGKVVLVYQQKSLRKRTLSYLSVASNSVTVVYTATDTLSSGSYTVEPRWSQAMYTQGIAFGIFGTGDGNSTSTISYHTIKTDTGTTTTTIPIPLISISTGAGVDWTPVYATIPYIVAHRGAVYFGYVIKKTDSGNASAQQTMTIFRLKPSSAEIFNQDKVIYIGNYSFTDRALNMIGNESGILVQFRDFNKWAYIQNGKMFSVPTEIMAYVNWDNKPMGSYSNAEDEIVVSQLITNKFSTIKLPTPIHGFIKSTASASANAMLMTKGQMDVTSLVSDRMYYLKDGYTNTGELEQFGSIPVGHTISTSKLLLDLS